MEGKHSNTPIKKGLFLPKCSHNLSGLDFFFYFLYGNEVHTVSIGISCVLAHSLITFEYSG